MGWERIVYKRQGLFDRVWAKPVTHVANEMGISGVALAKICRRMSIPLPGRGYWARKAVGSAPSKPTLRPARPDSPLTYVQNRYVGDPAELEAGASIRAEVERQDQAEPPLTVPDTLFGPHPLVARAAVVLQGGARRLDGILPASTVPGRKCPWRRARPRLEDHGHGPQGSGGPRPQDRGHGPASGHQSVPTDANTKPNACACRRVGRPDRH